MKLGFKITVKNICFIFEAVMVIIILVPILVSRVQVRVTDNSELAKKVTF